MDPESRHRAVPFGLDRAEQPTLGAVRSRHPLMAKGGDEPRDRSRIALVTGAFEIVAISLGTARTAGTVAAVGFVLVAGFQVALALGIPWGRAAWGGAHDRLPRRLRIASAFAAGFWIAAAFLLLRGAGYEVSPLPLGVARWGTWVLFGLLALGALINLASRSRWERFLMSPVAALLSLLCLLVALAG
jgi:hypothetical protein